MKKIISLLLTICMIVFASSTALAATDTDLTNNKTELFLVEENTNENYIKSTDLSTGESSILYETDVSGQYILIDENNEVHTIITDGVISYIDGIKYAEQSATGNISALSTLSIGYEWQCMNSFTLELKINSAIATLGTTAVALAMTAAGVPVAIANTTTIVNCIISLALTLTESQYLIYQNYMKMVNTYLLHQKYHVFLYKDAEYKNFVDDFWTAVAEVRP